MFISYGRLGDESWGGEWKEIIDQIFVDKIVENEYYLTIIIVRVREQWLRDGEWIEGPYFNFIANFVWYIEKT